MERWHLDDQEADVESLLLTQEEGHDDGALPVTADMNGNI